MTDIRDGRGSRPDSDGGSLPPAPDSGVDDESGVEKADAPIGRLATDDDRDAAVSALRDGFVNGQLTDEEHARRVSLAIRSRTLSDLDEITSDLKSPTDPPRRSLPTWIPVAVVVSLAAGLVGVLVATNHQSPQPQISAAVPTSPPSTSAGFPIPPSSTSLTPDEFVLSPPPRSDFLGVTPVFSAHGTGSQTSPPFHLDGGFLMGANGYDGATQFYLVPDGTSIAETRPFLGGGADGSDIPWSGGDGTRPAGTYRLEVEAGPDTHWTLTAREFWVTPPGVTISSAPAADNLGKPVLVATGSGSSKSEDFTLPPDPIGPSAKGTHDIVVNVPMSDATGVTAAYLVDQEGVTTALPLSGGPVKIASRGPYHLVVEGTGAWVIAIEYGDQWQW